MLTGLGMIGLLTISFSSVVADVWKLSGKWKSGNVARDIDCL